MVSTLVPKPPLFATSERPARCFPADLSVVWRVRFVEDSSWELRAVSRRDPNLCASVRYSLSELPEVLQLRGPLAEPYGGVLRLTISELYRAFGNGYDFSAAAERAGNTNRKPTFAFTALAGSQRGGGTIQVYRYANWLADLGFQVTVYSDESEFPAWAGLRAAYRPISDAAERYRAITEDIVLVYSLVELPEFLQASERGHQRVLHFCQGLEEFHFGETFPQILQSKPIFQLLSGLKVGRIAISPALTAYWEQTYRQRAFYIPNGLDPVFRQRGEDPPPHRFWGEGKRPLRIVQVANPGQRPKGTEALMEAASWLALREPSRRRCVHITFVSGPRPRDGFVGSMVPAGVGYTIKTGLSPAEVRAEYRSADVVVNCSFHEGFGMSTLEALASGAIVIQADNFGLDGVVEDLSHVVMYPPNNSYELAAALSGVMENAELRGRLLRYGGEVAERFTIERQYEAFLQVFSRLAGTSIAPREDFARVVELDCGGVSNAGLGGRVEVRELPRFSVLVPVYNHAHFLPMTLDTLRAQTYPHWEAIVVNDGSTDGTPAVMEGYARRDPRFKLVHKANGGTASALNAALDGATQEWICWLSSDDFFKANKLEIHAHYIEALPHIKFFHTCGSVFEDATGVEFDPDPPTHQLRVSPALQTLEMMRWNYVHGNAIAAHRSVFDSAGRFDPNYPNAQDFDMWLRMSVVTPFHMIKEITCTTRNHAGMGTAQFPAAGVFDSYRSIIAFVNGRSLEELTPFATPGSFQPILTKICLLTADQGAFLYRGTTARRSPLIEKLYAEATAPTVAPDRREDIVRFVGQFAAAEVSSATTPGVIREHFAPFARPIGKPYAYVAIDPIVELMQLYQGGLFAQQGEIITLMRQYFRKLRRHGIAGVPDLDDVFGPLERYGFTESGAPGR